MLTTQEVLQHLTEQQILEAVRADGCIGFCVACGAEADGVEPDARGYSCDGCGGWAVYGAEELLVVIGR